MNAFDIIPPHESYRFGKLSARAKEEYGKWAEAILRIAEVKSGIGKAITEWASKLNCTEGHVRRKFDEWRTKGSWEVFVNKALAGKDWWETDDVAFPEEFITHVYGLFGRNQRGKCLTQYRVLIRDWRAWQRGDLTRKIPGYDTPPQDCGCGHPDGWSYRNLMRLKPAPQRRLEMALTHQGVAAAMKLLPPIPGSRVGARFLEYVTIDDVWQDRKIIVPGYGSPVRLLQMGAMDYASGVYLKFGLRPELPTDDGTRERLKERDAKELIALMLEEYGYPQDYVMHIICERGTATIREADARALYELSGGRIKVCYTSMEGGLVLVWQESSTGNSRGKAWHESWHNLFHNEMASLPGQVGKDNEHQPMALAAQEKEARSMTTLSHFLSPEQKSRLKLPFSDLTQAHWETLAVVARINHRREHDCEGFDQLLEWKLSGFDMPPQSESALAKIDPAMLEKVEYFPRLETPWERLLKLRAQATFSRIPSWILPRFYEDDHAVKPIEGGRYTFTKRGKTLVFKPANPEDALPEDGKKYLGYCASIDPQVIHLTGEDGAFVATWVREGRISRHDQQALANAIREKTSLLNQTAATVRRQQRDFIEGEERRIRDNVAVLAEAGLIQAPGAPLAQNEVLTPGAAALHAATQIKVDRAKQAAPAPADDCTAQLLAREGKDLLPEDRSY